MNLRHAAIFALLGWYLMIPPVTGTTNPAEIEATNAPLSYWFTLDRFDSIDAFQNKATDLNATGEKERDESDDELLKARLYGPPPSLFKSAEAARIWAMGLVHAQCVATDDPRLAK